MTHRALIAGIGNIFMADDGFGVAVARRLMEIGAPAHVDVGDFGIRGMDLVYALLDDYDPVVFVDTVRRGEEPGTLYLIEHRVDTDVAASLDTHGMDPVKVVALARSLGSGCERAYVVACEPAMIPDEPDEIVMTLSEPVRLAVDRAAEMALAVVCRAPHGPGVAIEAQ